MKSIICALPGACCSRFQLCDLVTKRKFCTARFFDAAAAGVNHLKESEMELDHVVLARMSKKNSKKNAGDGRQKQGKQLSKTQMKKLFRQEQEKERKSSVFQQFSSHYEEQYGSRWSSLMSCLLEKPRVACLMNKYCQEQRLLPHPDAVQIPFLKLPTFQSSERFPHPERDSKNVFDYYLMDAASVLVTEALELEEGDTVLDLCAAPGGKTVGILQQLDLTRGSLTSNEPSETRRRRLAKVIAEYVPEILRNSVRVTRRNGIRWPLSEHYDKVLVDAPCSSERHLLHDSKELGTWTPRRTENCAKRQYALLTAALRSVKLEGRVVYSTCSLSQQENDGVIAKALERSRHDFEVIRPEWPVGEKTEHGWIVLPDAADGWGPIYIAVLKKVCNSLDFIDAGVVEGEEDEDLLESGNAGRMFLPASNWNSEEDSEDSDASY